MLFRSGIGIKCSETVYELPIDEQSRKAVDAILAREEIDPANPLIAINPMTTWKTKHWHNEGFAEVADRLLEKGFTVVFTGGPGDSAAVSNIFSLMRQQAVNLAGKTDLKTLAALFARCAAVISTDTGPMHIAAATGVPVVALFGPTAPWRTGPYGEKHKVVRAGISCRPCFKKQCETMECMKRIKAEQVLAAINQVFEHKNT